jgi:hypothetical protein
MVVGLGRMGELVAGCGSSKFTSTMSAQLPSTTKSFVLGEKQTRTLGDGKTIPYYAASVQERELNFEQDKGQVIVKILTAGFNHREVSG